MKSLTNPLTHEPIINWDFVNLFSTNFSITESIMKLDFVNPSPSDFSVTESLKRTHTLALRQDLTDEEDYDYLFEKEYRPNATPRAGLDQHSS